jgi:acyl carrier protein
MSDEIAEKITKYITEEILKQPSKRISPVAPLLSSGLIDSFHLVDLALFVEDNFGVRIEDSELNSSTFDTLDQLVALIQSRKKP